MSESKKLLYIFICLLKIGHSQAQMPMIRATNSLATIRVGDTFLKKNWGISAEVRPDIFEAYLKEPSTKIVFITDVDSITFEGKPGEKYPFVVLLNGRDSAFTEIRAFADIKPAHFNQTYKKANNGKTFTEIPPVYELVNVIMALTPSFMKDSNMVSRPANYYPKVMKYFGAYRNDPVVLLMDSLILAGEYFNIKMDAYSFVFDKQNRIVRSSVYDRTAWGRLNSLLPYIDKIQKFSDKTHFHAFYNQNRPFYASQIKTYQDTLQTNQMISWLNKNFPGTRYNAFKIIWSPLAGYNQSANWLEDSGFREMHAHVNFPYLSQTYLSEVSARSNRVKRGNIVFTEINHAFINPEAEKSQYATSIATAFKNLSNWETGQALINYNTPYACFNEYMNWGLVSLRYIDYADKKDLPQLLASLESNLVHRRGFTRFAEFNQYLVKLYQSRKPGTTIAELYPEIMGWFVLKSND